MYECRSFVRSFVDCCRRLFTSQVLFLFFLLDFLLFIPAAVVCLFVVSDDQCPAVDLHSTAVDSDDAQGKTASAATRQCILIIYY